MSRLRGILGFAAPFLVGVSAGAVFLHPTRPRSGHPPTWALVLLYVDEIVLALVLVGILVLVLVVWARGRKRPPRRRA